MWAYIIHSDLLNRFYTGQCADLVERLTRHNSGRSKATKNGIPWKLVWKKEMDNRASAMILERKIKKRGAKRFLEDETKSFPLMNFILKIAEIK